MGRTEILTEIRRYFDVEELVCDHTLAKYGERAWQFLATDYLHALLIIRRDILQRPMSCNSGALHQRGLRCNLCPIVKEKEEVYISAHILGCAGDFTVSSMTAEEARQMIKKYAHRLPCNIRIEGGVSWLHIDTLQQYGVAKKVYEFKA